MLTIINHTVAKAERLEEFLNLLVALSKETRENHSGCMCYTYYQNLESPLEIVLYEQWKDQESLEIHVEKLLEALGPPNPGESIPAKLLAFVEGVETKFYNVVE